jgi:hypothetical protein
MVKAEVLPDGRIGGVLQDIQDEDRTIECRKCQKAKQEIIIRSNREERRTRMRQKAWLEKNNPCKPLKPKGRGE